MPALPRTVLAAVLLVSGCTSTVSGLAGPGTRPSQAPELPARARELAVTGIDPCALLTPAQLDALQENGAPRLVDEDSTRDGPTCAFDVDATRPTYTYYLEVVDVGIEDWISGDHRETGMIQRPADVPGFPALVNYAPSDGIQDCETLVGVAAGRTLRAQMAPDDRSFDQRQLCDMATNVAKLAVQTLETLK
ncbi:DUF3558 domain-containing protein [Amycolatopsis endophytica]|uniref:DUF3558 domain-containing protein n=1 Tax=Amycolatopsis endophytica TaxID=860233 RepID=A0A853B0V9_9PSEU|nr:DUF3558 domain-containing protein [Amycolatopsis endophytica]NYI88678.1 hypothetical protein [Amycolatopsis endophytica]